MSQADGWVVAGLALAIRHLDLIISNRRLLQAVLAKPSIARAAQSAQTT